MSAVAINENRNASPRMAARVLTEIADADAVAIPLSEAERDALLEGLAELDRGEVATPAEVRAVYDKYRG
mgnify:CR=1 FL=1